MERKFTDDEIVKALECCSKDSMLNCRNCPYEESCNMGRSDMQKDALALIKRQKAEIERLTSAVDNSTKEFLKLHDEYQKQKADIEKMENKKGNMNMSCTPWSNEKERADYYENLYKEQFAEIERLQKHNTKMAHKHYCDGIKEFAERLKEKLQLNRMVIGYNGAFVEAVQLDSLVKEMTGENNGN